MKRLTLHALCRGSGGVRALLNTGDDEGSHFSKLIQYHLAKFSEEPDVEESSMPARMLSLIHI